MNTEHAAKPTMRGLISPIVLIIILPIPISKRGRWETALVGACGFIGIQRESSFVASVPYGIVCRVTSLPGVLFLLMTNDKR